MPLRLASVFKDELLNYRRLQLSGGIKDQSIERQLNFFDDFALENKIEKIEFTKEHISRWYQYRQEQGKATRYIRISFSIHFLLYLKSLGYDVCIPRLPAYTSTKFISYIFSDEQIEKYFESVDSYYSPKDPFVKLYLPVVFRILYTCGTRIGETLSIKVKDVDLENGIIKLRETKNGKERYIVIKDDLKDLLNQYADKCLYLKTENDYFFSHIDRRRVNEQSIYHFHRKALKDIGIEYQGGGKGPRLHDLRHTFAVKSLSNFERNGCDLYNVLPILSKYMGHTNISATEKYIRLVPHNFDEVIEKTEKTTVYIRGEKHESD